MKKFKTLKDIPEFPNYHSQEEFQQLIKEYIEAGAIPKDKLISGGWYIGQSRNCSIGQWFSKPGKFYFIKYKMGGKYVDDIPHFQDDNGFDVFVPFKLIFIDE